MVADDFDVGIGTAGFVVTAYTLPYGLCQLVYGPLGDRIGRLRVMRVGLAVFAVGTAACALAPGLPALILLRFLTGVAAAAMIPLTLAYIGDHYAYAERQATIASYLNAVALGQILGVSLGGSVADFLSWRAIFLAYGVIARRPRLGLLAAVPASASTVLNSAPRPSLPAFSRSRPISACFAIPPPGSSSARSAWRASSSAAASSTSAPRSESASICPTPPSAPSSPTYGIGGLIYSRLVRRILGRVGERGLVLLGGALVCTCLLGIGMAGTWIVIVPLIIVTGIGFYAIHGTLQTKATELSPGARGTAVALFAFALFLGQGMGAAAFGWVVSTAGYTAVFTTSAIAIAILATSFARTLTPRPAS